MSAARIATAAAMLVAAVALAGCGRLAPVDPGAGAPAADPSPTSLADVDELLGEAAGSLDDTERLLDDADDAAGQETQR
ncbi:hypothetical protein [Protaetiibacter mangrovi]|uniref:Uncharacterized protein n=1 Tax=Protaetiibacter mangrovi TaxID=2970926 RepID=A0ABT1ZGF0_9MICO|nr:hypothetical protein [Protaetiibacter mangrovi]MCS0499791.1 hypothetical protein [Protaetiibacter mangrovi]